MAITIPVKVVAEGAKSVGSQISSGLSAAKSSIKGFGAEVNKAFDNSALGRFRGDLEGALPSGLQNLTGKMGTFAIAAVAVGAAIYSGLSAAADQIEQMQNRADAAGISLKSMMAVDLAGKMNGLGDRPAKAIEKFTLALGQAADGSEAAQKKFEDLGVSITDSQGYMKSNEQIMQETIQALNDIPSAAERSAKAVEIFGKGSAQALQVLGGNLEDTMSNMQQLGMAIPDDAVERIKAFDNAGDSLGATFSAISADLSSQFAPAFAAAMDALKIGLREAWNISKPVFEGLGLIAAIVTQGIKNLTAGVEVLFAKSLLAVQDFANKVQKFLPDEYKIIDIDRAKWQSVIDDATAGVKDISQVVEEFYSVSNKALPEKTKKKRSDADIERERRAAEKAAEAAEKAAEAARKKKELRDKKAADDQAKATAAFKKQQDDINAATQAAIDAQREKDLQNLVADQEARAQIELDVQSFLSEQKKALADSDFEYKKALDEESAAWTIQKFDEAAKVFAGNQAMMSQISKLRIDSEKALEKKKFESNSAYALQFYGLISQAAKDMFGENKAIAIADAIVNTAVGVTKALASAPPPWNLALAAATGAAGAAQIAKISAQNFATGGFPVGANANVVMNERGQEAILNASATARIGRKAIDSLNSGAAAIGNSLSVNYSPVINFSGSGSSADLERVIAADKVTFGKFMKDLQNRGFA